MRRHRRIALDTSVFIYELEEHPRYASLAHEVFLWLEQPNHVAVTSTVTMTELLVKPNRLSDNWQVNRFYALLTRFPNLEWIAPDLAIADSAAKVRAMYGIRTPDALQAATAIQHGATGFITNDSVFKRVTDFETIVLEHLL